MNPLDLLAALGRGAIGAVRGAGSLAMFALSGVSHLLRPPFYPRMFARALLEIGYFSLPVVALTAIFTGMVLALQSYLGFSRFSAQSATANVVVLSITRELGPVLAGLMVAGRIGAAMAAEIGTMRVTDQIDALTTLSTNPMKYLVTPRLLAGVIALPALVVVADILGVMGGFIVGTLKLGFGPAAYLHNTFNFMQTIDVVSGLVKAAVFGFLIALMGCYQGYQQPRRRRGRGRGHHRRRGRRLDPHPGLRLRADRAVLHLMSEAKIRVRGLRKSFGDKRVLDGVDLDVAAGSTMVVIGGSGSGKSVLVKCILGLLEPDAGRIEIDGRDLLAMSSSDRARVRTGIGMLFQNGALFDSLPVWENVAFGLLARRQVSRRQARGRATEFLAQVGLAKSVGDLYPAELSGGMQKRVALARAIAARPDIMFFDEPTTGLDPIMGAVIDALIVDCVRHLGGTAIAITHDIPSARRIGDQAAMLADGRIIWTGAATALMESGNPAVDQFTHGRREGPIQMELRR